MTEENQGISPPDPANSLPEDQSEARSGIDGGKIPSPPPTGPRQATSPFQSMLRKGRGENMDFFKAMFLGLVVTAVFYEVFPLPFIDQGRVRTLFDNRVSEIIMAMTLWSMFMLLFKFFNQRRQALANAAFGSPGVQQVLAGGVYVRNADDVLEKIRAELAIVGIHHYQSSAIYRRVEQILQYIRAIAKKESIHNFLEHQSQIDMKKLESGYTVLHVFIWAIPILGFIGTVLGIGEAVNNFSLFIQTAEGGSQFSGQMRNALGGVTSGLAVAFNTTFLALLLVIPVMLLTSLLQKREEENLLAVEEYCMEELLPHLRITPSNDSVTESFDDHMHRILQLSSAWLGELEPLVGKLREQTEMVGHQIGGIQPLIKAFTDRLLPNEGQSKQKKSAVTRDGTSPKPPESE